MTSAIIVENVRRNVNVAAPVLRKVRDRNEVGLSGAVGMGVETCAE